MELQYVLTDLFGASRKEAMLIQSKFQIEHLRKGDFFLRQHQRCTKLSFIVSGIFRVYAETEHKEVTQWIGGENYFMTDLHSFLFDQPSRWSIRALTDVKILTLHLTDYRAFERDLPQWNIFEKRFIAKCFSMLEDRIFAFIALSAEERYQRYFEANREMFNQVPLQYIASMLGMSPETLSRIRAKVGFGE